MTIQELRVFYGEWGCGCGDPAAALEALRDILAAHPLHSNRERFEALVLDEGQQYLLLYLIAHLGLTEHGGGIGGGWLTEKGQDVLDALNHYDLDDVAEQCCMHGYAIDDELMDCPDCRRLQPA